MGHEQRDTHLDVHVIACDNGLPADGTDLYFNIHNPQAFRTDVNLNETGVHGLVKLAKTCDQTDRTLERCETENVAISEMPPTLLDVAEGVRARAAWYGTNKSNDSTKALKERAIYTMRHLNAPQTVSMEWNENAARRQAHLASSQILGVRRLGAGYQQVKR